MSREKVGELYAELGIEDLTGPQLRKAQAGLDAFHRHAQGLADPTVTVRANVDEGRTDELEAKLRGLDSTEVEAEVDVDTTKAEEGLEGLKVRTGELRGLLGGLALAAGFKFVADQASDLNESVNVTGLIFKDARGEIDEFVKSSAKLGFSEAEARQLTGSIGGLLLNLGLSKDETVDWSKKLLTLGADMGSAFNAEPAQAVEAIGAAMRGETEPIRAFNVVLDDARVRAKAVEMGLASSSAEVDNAARARATLQLITEQTSAVEGDFANTADQAANAQRVAAAEAKNAAASIGADLLPIIAKAAQGVSWLADEFSGLDKPIQTAILSTAGLVFIAPRAVDSARALRDMYGAIRSVGSGSDGATGSIGRMLSAVGPAPISIAAAGIGILTAEFLHMREEAARVDRNIASLRASLEQGETPYESMLRKLAQTMSGMEGGFENLDGSAKNLKDTLAEVGVGLPSVATALVGDDREWARFERQIADSFDIAEERRDALLDNPGEFLTMGDEEEKLLRLIRNLEAFRGQGKDAAESWNAFVAEMEAGGVAADGVADAVAGVTGAGDDLASRSTGWLGPINDQTTAWENQTAAVRDLIAEIRTQQALVGDAYDAQSAYQSSIFGVEDARKALKDARNGGSADEIERAEQRLSDALVRQSEAKVTLAQKEAEVAGEILHSAEAVSIQRGALESLTTELGFTNPELDTLIGRLQDAEKTYVIGLDAEQAKADARQVREDLERIYELTHGPGIPPTRDPDGRVSGGIAAPGKVTVPPTRDPDARLGNLLPATNLAPLPAPTPDAPTVDQRPPVPAPAAGGNTTNVYLGSMARANRDGLWERAA